VAFILRCGVSTQQRPGSSRFEAGQCRRDAPFITAVVCMRVYFSEYTNIRHTLNCRRGLYIITVRRYTWSTGWIQPVHTVVSLFWSIHWATGVREDRNHVKVC